MPNKLRNINKLSSTNETHTGFYCTKQHLHDVLAHVDKTKFGMLLFYDTEMYKNIIYSFQSH